MSQFLAVGDQNLTHDLDRPAEVAYPSHRSQYAGLAEAPVMHTFGQLTRLAPDRVQDWDHWRRLRRKFLEGGLEVLTDVEILEIFLAVSSPKPKRYNQLSVELIARFGSLAAVVHANPRELLACAADNRRATYMAIALLKCVHVASVRLLRRDIVDRPIMSSSIAVLNYCTAKLAHLRHEELHILFLNRKNMMITSEVLQRGTVDHVPLYPREVAKRCLELGASAIVMVHNHPSGDPTPSKVDITITEQLVTVLRLFDIPVHDHLIIGHGRYASLREMGLC